MELGDLKSPALTGAPATPARRQKILAPKGKIDPMSTLIRWNPFQEMEAMQRQMASLFDWPQTRPGLVSTAQESLAPAMWTPLVDITADGKEYLIKVELPGMQREDVRLTMEAGTLSISGERKAEPEEKGRIFHRVERAYGRFERSFELPEDATTENIKAEFQDGLLRVHVTKNEKAQPHLIEVKID